MTEFNPFVLIILDGFGYREETKDNAIALANTPMWNKLWQTCPHMLIQGSGTDVGLPEGQMGNSEVGHLNLGAGRIIFQEFSRINNAIANGSFNENPVFIKAIDEAIQQNKKIHILGLLSQGGVHSHEDQLFALIQLAAARGSKQVYLHAFLDGRDTPPKSAESSLQKAAALLDGLHAGQIASIIGRYYAMDRDKRWDRIASAYQLLTEGTGEFYANSAIEALQNAYNRGETDEFVKATAILTKNHKPIVIEDGDCVIFMNYRADRARQITRAFIEPDFHEFMRNRIPKVSHFVSLTEYAKDIPTETAFKPSQPKNTLGELFANLKRPQLRIAETEKYAHVTFFFNGGREESFPLEDRELIPSPNVATYDMQPEMNATLLTDKLVAAIESRHYQLIVCNYANPDMVGHSGNLTATIKAIETIDQCLQRIIAAIDKACGQLIITSDHGNAECMFDNETQQAHTAHTTEPVPLIYYGKAAKIIADNGSLCDIAPTLLNLLAIPIPSEMTGKVLIKLI